MSTLQELRYMETVAEEAEFLLGRLEMKKKQGLSFLKSLYSQVLSEEKTNNMISAIEEAIDDETHGDREQMQKSMAEYETVSRRTHERQESTVSV